ncbi:hypothetical protein D9M71_669160 [compost metagenome]
MLGLDGLDEFDGLGDARLQLFEGGFLVGIARHFDSGEAGYAAFGTVAGDLYLAGEGEHVRGQAGADQHRRIDGFRLGMGGGLAEDGRKIAEHAGEHWNGSFVDRQGHADTPGGCGGLEEPVESRRRMG